jgi:2-(1,2-epoxy-1,2-dihydrophenyl)acetyl-CoA isomerase
MLGDKISAEEAEKMGMIYKVFTAESFAEEVQKLALKLANMPTKALGLIKKSLNQSLSNNLENQLALESKYQIEAAGTDDYAEGVAAFIEKRKPNFKGK